MSDKSEPTTLREMMLILVISLPLAVGLFFLLDHLDGVDKSGWVWWPALLGFLFSVAAVFSCLVSLAGNYFSPYRRVAGEWTGTIVGYCIAATIILWIVIPFFDALSEVSRREVGAFIAGGLLVYCLCKQRK